MFVVADHAGMRAVAEPVEKGQSRVLLDAAFPLAEAAEAHARGETDRATGKTRLHGPLGSCRDSPRARGP